MFKEFKKIIESQTCFIVGDAEVEFNKFTPDNSHGEFVETFIVIEMSFNETKRFAHILQTYDKYGRNELRYMYISDNKDKTFDFNQSFADKPELFRLMDKENISIDELAEDIYNRNNNPLPNYSIRGIHIYFKLNEVLVPVFMETEYWENQQGETETRFIIQNREQRNWLANLLYVDAKYLEEYEYVTLYS